MPRLAAQLCVLALAVSCKDGDDRNRAPEIQPVTVPTVDAGAASPNVNPPHDVRYDETIAGLEKLMSDLRSAILEKDEPEIVRLVDSLRLPNYRAWMKETFGDELGTALADEYTPQFEEIGSMVQLLTEQFDAGQTRIYVERFHSAAAPQSTGYQSAALRRMRRGTPLYSVRLSTQSGTRTFHLWSFVHAHGTFRYVGKMRAVAEKRTIGGRDLNEYRIADAERLAPAE